MIPERDDVSVCLLRACALLKPERVEVLFEVETLEAQGTDTRKDMRVALSTHLPDGITFDAASAKQL